jgi:hypothetical protein
MNCPICQTKKTLYKPAVIDIFTKEIFKIKNCTNCDFEWIENRPLLNQISRYYDNSLGSKMWKKKDCVSTKMQQVIFFLDTCRLLNMCTRQDLIIDWGAGHGELSRYLKNKRYNVESVDFFSKDLWLNGEIPYSQINSNDFLDSVVEDFLNKKKPKAVILRHTLEHFLYPEKIINCFYRAGVEYVLIIVPNHKSFFRKIFKQYWHLWDPPRHLNFFSTKNLDLLHSQNNYEVVCKKTYGIDEVYNSISRWIHLRNKEGSISTRLFPLNGIISSFSSAIFYPFSNSVIWSLYIRKAA